MKNNLFEEFRHKREQLKNFAKIALEKNWISEESYQELMTKIDNDTLTIGVIGQMKAGKSTFLNAFLFGDEVLPSATTPMTAALSVITYGEEKEIEVEFYTSDEWQEMKLQASRKIEEAGGDKPTESKIKAAQELVEKSHKIGAELDSILGKTKKDKFENLIEYVGADGKYVSITKSVTVYYPKEWLKGIRVVDTPGFNDPVVSREERTQEFLKEADAVLLLLYAGRAFDATDRDIVFDKIRKVGIGKILIGVNKYDIQYGQGETVDDIVNNVKEEIEKACKEQGDDRINELLKNIQPIPFSASMALMAKKSLEQILNDETLKFYWDKACDDFEIQSPSQMFEKSLMTDIEQAFKETIQNSKGEILLKKPINFILQSGTNKLEEIKDKINKNTANKKNLELSDEGWGEKAKQLERTGTRINHILDERFHDAIKKAYNAQNIKKDLSTEIETYRNKATNTINNAGRFHKDKTKRELENESDNLTRKITSAFEKTNENIKNITNQKANEIFTEIESVLRRFIIDDFEDIRGSFKHAIRNIEYKNDWNITEEIELTDEGFFSVLTNWRDAYHNDVRNFAKNLDKNIDEFLNKFDEQNKYYLQSVNESGVKHILPDLINMREEYNGKEEERKREIEKINLEIKNLEIKKQDMEQEVEEMKNKSKGIL